MTCSMTGILAECLAGPGPAWCLPCCELELGESMMNISARTGQGVPKGKFYRDLERKQAEDSRDLAGRASGWSRYE